MIYVYLGACVVSLGMFFVSLLREDEIGMPIAIGAALLAFIGLCTKM